MGPEFNELWDRYFKDKPDKPVMFGSIVAGAYADHTVLPPGKYITMYVHDSKLQIPDTFIDHNIIIQVPVS